MFVFTVEWRTLEDHTVGFRGSDLFTQWRALIGPHFDGAPVVEHVDPFRLGRTGIADVPDGT